MDSSGLDSFRERTFEIEEMISSLSAAAKRLLSYLPTMQDDLFDTAIENADQQYNFSDEDYQKILDISDGMDESIAKIKVLIEGIDIAALATEQSKISAVFDQIDEVIYGYYDKS